ncbi:MAG: nuclear transport factor 2 family protein [Candidatus Omnitrophica bacterium]|nr:nuclear transport factor 2 family protein [Candidatus Omnitrophota bacterium]
MVKGKISPGKFFVELNKDTMHLVDAFYDESIVFQDPLISLNGRQAMRQYYERMYKNVEYIHFDITDEIFLEGEGKATLVWRMTLIAKHFNGNKPLKLDGVSVIHFGGKDGKAVYHRDYFDMGAFVYESVPLLGSIIRFIKKKMRTH